MKNYTRAWIYAGLTMPFTALTAIIITNVIGWESILDSLVSIILIVFITTCVIWWWWAMHYIGVLTKTLIKTEEKFSELKKELKEIRKLFR